MRKGLLFTIEGADGVGKSTQAQLLLERLRSQGFDTLLTREPGGTPIGEDVRRILLNPSFDEMIPLCEVFLYCAARVQFINEIIEPALEKGLVVVSDRFTDSTFVYQGYAGGVDPEIIEKLNIWATGALQPDKTFLLDLPPEESRRRLEEKQRASGLQAPDRIEQKNAAFHQRVREGFLHLAAQNPRRISVIDGIKDPQEIHRCIWEQVEKLLNNAECRMQNAEL